MMSINPINSIEYYEELAKEDYYTQGGEPPGKWIGRGARALMLSSTIETVDYRRIFNGFGPDGKKLCENAGDDHRPGWDVTFSAPKSVSILWARANEEVRKTIQAAQQSAVERALTFLEDKAAFTRRGKGGKALEHTTGLIAATFEHSTSRAQDAQLHTHCLIANLAERQDETWGTLESKPLFFWQKAASGVYRSQLANGLRELGFAVEAIERKPAFEVKGICQQLCALFSKRSDAIRAQMEAMGVTNANSKIGDIIAVNSRDYKKAIDRPALFAKWEREMDERGFTADKIEAIRDIETELYPEPLPLSAVLDSLIEDKAVFRLQDIYAEVAKQAQYTHSTVHEIEDTVRELLTDELMVSLGKDINHNPIYTTKAMLAIEQALAATADAMHFTAHYRLDSAVIDKAIDAQQAAQGFELSDEQHEAVHAVCQSGLGIIQGKAGAGKSTSLQALRLAYESQGITVRGAAVARKTAQQLQNGTGIESGTLASLLNELGKGSAERFKNTVIVIDEAGLMSTPDMLELVSAAHKASTKLVLVGEQEQLDAISHGGSLRYLSQRLSCARINNIRRQREVWAKTLVNDLRSGNAEAALSTLQGKGLLHIHDTAHDTREALVNQWAAYTKANPGKQSLVMAQRWKEVKPLNDLMRKVYQQRGLLGNENVITECVVSNQTLHFAFSTGERVRLTKNDYTRNFTNGQQGTVTAVIQLKDDLLLTIALDDGRTASIKQSEYCDDEKRFHVVQAYASTVYSAQGATIDGDTFTYYSTAMDRAASYVAGSRAKDKAWFFINGQELDAQCGVCDNGDQPDMATRLDVLARNMKVNKHKSMAMEYLDEQMDAQRELAFKQIAEHEYGFTSDL
tara:strand:+ start:6268 stop:8838 length:2571 start_codon:yes stop_codon:yes gene_type:complete